MNIDDAVFELQRLYPMIYHACHTDHGKKGKGEPGLSQRDGAILSHLTEPELRQPAELGRHLRLAPSTVSEALQGLARAGYASIERNPDDERRVSYELSERGRTALQEASVLESDRVHSLMLNLSAPERRVAMEGMRLIAQAARKMMRLPP